MKSNANLLFSLNGQLKYDKTVHRFFLTHKHNKQIFFSSSDSGGIFLVPVLV